MPVFPLWVNGIKESGIVHVTHSVIQCHFQSVRFLGVNTILGSRGRLSASSIVMDNIEKRIVRQTEGG